MTSRSIWPRKSLVPHAHASTVPTTWSAGKLGQTDAGADTDAVEEDEQHESLETNTLVGWDELLAWQQENEYILTGFQRANPSYLNSLKGAVRVHNETVNIWSHILGALAFLTLGWSFHLTHGFDQDVSAVFLYLASVVACFVLSFTYHIFMHHSSYVRIWTCRLDYLGIVIPLWGTTVSSTHFGFRDSPALQNMYQTIATLSAAFCAIITLHPSFSGAKNRRFRTCVYLLLGLSSFVPVVHGIKMHGLGEHDRRMRIGWYLGLGVCHATGALVYAARIPERWWPERFDLVGSSHQCMHACVVAGAMCYAVGLLGAFEHWKERDVGLV